jgi:hypothetical protein
MDNVQKHNNYINIPHKLLDLTQFKTSIFSECATMNNTKYPDTLTKTDTDAIIIKPV